MKPERIQLSLLDRDWVNEFAPVILEAMRGRESFSSDDVHAVIVEPENRNYIGVAIAKLANEGKIRRIGSVKSKRSEANSRWVGQYVVQ